MFNFVQVQGRRSLPKVSILLPAAQQHLPGLTKPLSFRVTSASYPFIEHKHGSFLLVVVYSQRINEMILGRNFYAKHQA
jgi:hypothetical protein